MSSAICATLAIAAAVMMALGGGPTGIHAALAATARLMFLLFWAAYCGGALVTLFGIRLQPLKAHARELGLAFSSALFVHLSLVGMLCWIGDAPGAETFIFFGIGAAFAYLLALFSFRRTRLLLGPQGWWLLSNVGMNYLAYAFIVDFVKEPLSGGLKRTAEYLPFAVLSLVAPALRLAAFGKRVVARAGPSSPR
jgi:hypothetical protein